MPVPGLIVYYSGVGGYSNLIFDFNNKNVIKVNLLCTTAPLSLWLVHSRIEEIPVFRGWVTVEVKLIKSKLQRYLKPQANFIKLYVRAGITIDIIDRSNYF